jgi:hypothetical protein
MCRRGHPKWRRRGTDLQRGRWRLLIGKTYRQHRGKSAEGTSQSDILVFEQQRGNGIYRGSSDETNAMIKEEIRRRKMSHTTMTSAEEILRATASPLSEGTKRRMPTMGAARPAARATGNTTRIIAIPISREERGEDRECVRKKIRKRRRGSRNWSVCSGREAGCLLIECCC